MIDNKVLQSLIDPKNPYKALEYIEENMTEEDLVQWLTKKILEQKDNEIIEIPLPLMFNIFMEYIQDICKEPYDIFPIEIDKSPFDIFDLTFYNYNNLTTEKWSKLYFKLLIQGIVKKNNGSAKKFNFYANLYNSKNKCSIVDFFDPIKFLMDINEFLSKKEN